MLRRMDQELIDAVMRQESRGNPNAVSPKGARGTMQTMPGTEHDPGFGVQPLDPTKDLAQERERVGKDYLAALMNHYGDANTALVAYNWGPGNTNKWLAAGADPAHLPAETRHYVTSINNTMTPGDTAAAAVQPAVIPGPMAKGAAAAPNVPDVAPAESPVGAVLGSLAQSFAASKQPVGQAPQEDTPSPESGPFVRAAQPMTLAPVAPNTTSPAKSPPAASGVAASGLPFQEGFSPAPKQAPRARMAAAAPLGSGGVRVRHR